MVCTTDYDNEDQARRDVSPWPLSPIATMLQYLGVLALDTHPPNGEALTALLSWRDASNQKS
eukprot:1433446-Amphidinium_carterae.1